MASLPTSPHFLLFPFMSKGHTIPLLHLAHLLLRRNISITFVTTPLNSPFIRQSLTATNASVIDLPFPQNIPEIPEQTESTDKLPSMSLFIPFVTATKLMQPDFDHLLQNLPRVSCIISDGFLAWTQHSASKLGIPRLYFYGMNSFAMVVSRVVGQERCIAGVKSDDELFTVPNFPTIQLTKNDFEYPFNDPDASGPHMDFIIEQGMINMQSKGLLVNSFHELEGQFVDYLNNELGSNAWCIGPLPLVKLPKAQSTVKPKWKDWLDDKLTRGRPVLYVAFGSQAEITPEQLQEIATGLEKSEVSFLWVVRSKFVEEMEGFEQRVEDRGLVVREWVDQMEILSHESVKGFMSHCGWNSVMESLCESVPILAWPMLAEQHLNARLVVEELGVGIRVRARNGSVRGFVGSECIESAVRELMEGEKGKEVRKKVKEVGELARKAMGEGGSSWRTLDLLLEEICTTE